MALRYGKAKHSGFFVGGDMAEKMSKAMTMLKEDMTRMRSPCLNTGYVNLNLAKRFSHEPSWSNARKCLIFDRIYGDRRVQSKGLYWLVRMTSTEDPSARPDSRSLPVDMVG